MRKVLILLITSIQLISCAEDKQEDCCVVIDMAVRIKYLDQLGNNLLEVEGGIKESDLKIYHKIKDEWVAYYKHNLDYPKGIRIDKREEGHYLWISLSHHIDEDSFSETKIEFSEGDADIIKAEIDLNYSNMIATRVWYNGELKWEAYESERVFEVVK